MSSMSKKSHLLLIKKIMTIKLLLLHGIKKVRKKRFWVRQIYTERKEKGEYHLLVRQMMLHDKEFFFQCFRMSPTRFEELLKLVAPMITKETT